MGTISTTCIRYAFHHRLPYPNTLRIRLYYLVKCSKSSTKIQFPLLRSIFQGLRNFNKSFLSSIRMKNLMKLWLLLWEGMLYFQIDTGHNFSISKMGTLKISSFILLSSLKFNIWEVSIQCAMFYKKNTQLLNLCRKRLKNFP